MLIYNYLYNYIFIIIITFLNLEGYSKPTYHKLSRLQLINYILIIMHFIDS